MGVTIDKSRGNTIVEGVSIKSVTEGGSAALAKSHRGVGLKLGMCNMADMALVYIHPCHQQCNRSVLVRSSFWQCFGRVCFVCVI